MTQEHLLKLGSQSMYSCKFCKLKAPKKKQILFFFVPFQGGMLTHPDVHHSDMLFGQRATGNSPHRDERVIQVWLWSQRGIELRPPDSYYS